MALREKGRYKEKLIKIRKSGKTKNFLIFLLFVCIAFVFWLILALNDDVQRNIEINIKVENVPDSVTFLTEPPTIITVNVRDRGGRLMAISMFKQQTIHLNFNQFADGEVFRVSKNQLHQIVKDLFANDAMISSITPDSIRSLYTTGRGIKVPVIPVYDVTCVSGMAISGHPMISPDSVTIFGMDDLGSIKAIYTDKITLRDIDKAVSKDIRLKQIPNVRIKPAAVSVTFNVEQLVKKVTEVPVTPGYVPAGEDILFFPAKVKVSYYVPVSKYNQAENALEVRASFDEAVKSVTDKVSIKVTRQAPYMERVELLTDSVQYTLVKDD